MSPPRPEVLAFLQDIKQNPDDDTPRLIFADWLEENNDPRGEFMRLQCELARHTTRGSHQKALQSRERELLTTYTNEWLTPLHAGSSGAKPEGMFRRGLIHLRMPLGTFFQQAWSQLDAWQALESTAWIERITLWNLTSFRLAELVAAPVMSQFTALCLNASSEARFSVAEILADSPYCSNLVSLEMLDFGIDDSDLIQLTEAQHLTQLKQLKLIDNSLRGPGLLGLSKFTALEALDLSRNQLGDEGARSLSMVAFAGLKTLALDYNRVGDRGLRSFATSPSLTNLRTLSLVGNLITSAGAAALAAPPALTNLRTLTLSQNLIGAKGADALVASPYLKQLTVLDLQGNVLPDAKKAILKERFGDALRL